MVKLFLENKGFIELKFDAIYITTDHKENVCVNSTENPVANSSRIYLDNGDSIGIHANKVFIETKTTEVYVNNELFFYMIPQFLAPTFRDICKSAISIKKDMIDKKEIIIADFKLFDLEYKIFSPPTPNGAYRFVFKDVLPQLSRDIASNILLFNKLKLNNFEIEMGEEKNILVLKKNKFTYDDYIQAIFMISEFQKKSRVEMQNSQNYTA